MNQQRSVSKSRHQIRSLVLIAMFAALTAVLSQLAIPMPWLVPISLGNLAGFLAVGLLNWKEAAASQVVWIMLGMVGAPVYSGFGSLSRLTGPTGGYIIGYAVCALAAGLILTRSRYRFWEMAAAMAVGLVLCYAFGTVWYMVLMKVSLSGALMSCVVPYLPGDGVKIVLAALLGVKLRARLQRIV